MSNAWFRMYSEFAFDPKVQMMPEAMQRRLVMLFCNRCSNVASVADATELCFMLRISPEELEETKALFIQKGFIDATWSLLHWEKRQYTAKSSTERSRRFREKHKNTNATEMQRDATDETPDATRCNAPDTDTDTEQKERKSRGSRFALDSPPPEWIQFCVTQRPDLNPGKTFEIFKNHWQSKPGKDGLKLDWFQTWQNWVYREKLPSGGQNANKLDLIAQGIAAARASRQREITG